MNPYLFAAALGILGLVAMALLGLHAGHSPGHPTHTHGHAPSQTHGHTAHGQAGGHSAHPADWLLGLLSPIVLLSLVLGFGLVGLLLTTLHLPALLVLPLSLVGAVLFQRYLVQPYWNVLLRFQSRPARSLGSAVMSRAEAVTDFGARGRGLVRLEFEGEVRQLLATLESAEQGQGARVRRGDTVRVESIDEETSSCVVSLRV